MNWKLFWTYTLLVFSMATWGGSFIFTPIVFKTLDPFTTIWCRLAISGIFLLPIMLIFFRKSANFNRKDVGKIAFLALFQPFLYFIGEHLALEIVDSITTSLLVSTIPVFTAIIVWMLYRKNLAIINIIGIIISFVGVIIMVVNENMELTINTKGLGLLMVAVITAVCYGLLLDNLVERVNVVWVIFLQNIFGLIYFTPVVLIFGHEPTISQTSNLSFLTPNQEFWIALLILGLFCSSLSYIFFGNAVKLIGIARTAVFDNLSPIFSAIIAFLILGQILTLRQLIGMIIIISGVMLTQRKSPSLINPTP